MKSKIQIVIVMIMIATLGAGGVSTNTQGNHRAIKGQFPISTPQEIIGPTCPGTSPCVK